MNEGWSGGVLLAWGFVCSGGRRFTLGCSAWRYQY